MQGRRVKLEVFRRILGPVILGSIRMEFWMPHQLAEVKGERLTTRPVEGCGLNHQESSGRWSYKEGGGIQAVPIWLFPVRRDPSAPAHCPKTGYVPRSAYALKGPGGWG